MTLPSGTPNKHENYVAHLYNDITEYANYAKVEKLNIDRFNPTMLLATNCRNPSYPAKNE